MKLIEATELLRRQPPILGTEDRERSSQPFRQTRRAIVIAYAIKTIRHCNAPLRLGAFTRILSLGAPPDLQARSTSASGERLFAIMLMGYEAGLHNKTQGARRR